MSRGTEFVSLTVKGKEYFSGEQIIVHYSTIYFYNGEVRVQGIERPIKEDYLEVMKMINII